MWEKIKEILKGSDVEGVADDLKLQMTNLNTRYVAILEQAEPLYNILDGMGGVEDVTYLPLVKQMLTGGGGVVDNLESHEEVPADKADPLPGRGHRGAKVAFVSASPSKLDKIRNRPFSGMVGKTLEELYIEPLDLTLDDVYLTNIVKDLVTDEAGNPIEPTAEQIQEALPEFVKELEEVGPVAVVALGKSAHKALAEIAAEWVPHPRAIRIWGNSGEVERKMNRLRKSMQDGYMHLSCEIIKQDNVNEDRQIVYGVVMEPNENDTDLNWTTPEEIEKAAHYFMRNFQLIDTDHTRVDIDAVPVESWVSPDDTMLGGKLVKAGSWVMGVHITDSDQWGKIKSGEYTGFSIDALAKIDPNSLIG